MSILKNFQKKNDTLPTFRHEFKYRCSDQAVVLLQARLKGLMKLDQHATDASYEIRSIYFDDSEHTCYKQNEAGCDPRSKYRIRAYNCDDSRIVLERKIKQRGMTKKESALLSKELFTSIMNGDIQGEMRRLSGNPKRSAEENLILRFLTLMLTRGFRPEVIVLYERIPYVEKKGNVRITFDTNISSSVDFAHFFDNNIVKMPVMKAGEELMEVKYDAYLPAYLREALECGQLSQTTFSKYYICRHERIRR